MARGVKHTDREKGWNRARQQSSAALSRVVGKAFLIVCEGESTEPAYFESFPVAADIKTVAGVGSRTALVKAAIKLAKADENKGREVWCVFDFDAKGDDKTIPEDFNRAIAMAEAAGLKVGWSNDCFELWLLLHYQTLQSALTRDGYFTILEKLWSLPHSYRSMGKEKSFARTIYARLQNDSKASQVQASERAAGLIEDHLDKKSHAERCPCTTVHLLVAELNKYLKR